MFISDSRRTAAGRGDRGREKNAQRGRKGYTRKEKRWPRPENQNTHTEENRESKRVRKRERERERERERGSPDRLAFPEDDCEGPQHPRFQRGGLALQLGKKTNNKQKKQQQKTAWWACVAAGRPCATGGVHERVCVRVCEREREREK